MEPNTRNNFSDLVSTFNSAPFINNNINWNKSILITTLDKSDMQINDIVEALFNIGIDLKDLNRIGHIQAKYITLLQFNSESPVRKLMEIKTISLSGRSAFCCKPMETIDIYINYLPISVPDSELNTLFSQYGSVQFIREIYIYHPLLQHRVSSDRRLIRIIPKPNIVLTDIPYQIFFKSFKCPVFIKGRPIRCFRCNLLNHSKRSCSAPACERCGLVKHLVSGCLATSPSSIKLSFADVVSAQSPPVNANPQPSSPIPLLPSTLPTQKKLGPRNRNNIEEAVDLQPSHSSKANNFEKVVNLVDIIEDRLAKAARSSPVTSNTTDSTSKRQKLRDGSFSSCGVGVPLPKRKDVPILPVKETFPVPDEDDLLSSDSDTLEYDFDPDYHY